MKKILLLCAALLAVAANAQGVYKPYKEFIFEAEMNLGDSVRQLYVSMWTTDSAFWGDASQRQLFYAYHDSYNKDSLAAAWPYTEHVESTGIIENEKKVWLHPPRSDAFALFEYFPFPEMKFPLKCDRKYRRYYIGDVDGHFKILRYKITENCINGNVDDGVVAMGRHVGGGGEWHWQVFYDKDRGFTSIAGYLPDGRFIGLYLKDVVEHKGIE
ncbi:MAG: hypothetical protein IKP83_00425 [Bacteroidales bacterium]|nr:hypothetical protein [Bacteroidales bacterium]